jgi:C_GCAxxG_C_C family probable redox protein
LSGDRDAWTEKAASYFAKGYNCAQSVLLTMQEHWRVSAPVEPTIASGFAGGIGRQGSVCGAVIGGVMAIGLKYGTNEASVQKRENVSHQTSEFLNQFKKQCGSVYCRDLIGFDLSTPEGREKAWAANVFQEKCRHFVECAVRILMDSE